MDHGELLVIGLVLQALEPECGVHPWGQTLGRWRLPGRGWHLSGARLLWSCLGTAIHVTFLALTFSVSTLKNHPKHIAGDSLEESPAVPGKEASECPGPHI